MRSIFSSIKFQIIFSFSLLILPLFFLAYFNFFSNSLFSATLEKKVASDELFALTSGLEKNVVDLQRNALIYKDSASASSVLNVDKLYSSLVDIISALRKIDILTEDVAMLDSIEYHLSEYKNNFDIVVGYRKKQNAYIDEHIAVKVADFRSSFIAVDLSPESLVSILDYLSSARISSLGYLAENKYNYVDLFKTNIADAKKIIHSSDELSPESKEELLRVVEGYEKNFLKIAIAHRNYTYLISVVMAGSAKEVLYSANFLQKKSKSSSLLEQEAAEKTLKKLGELTVVLSFFGVLMAIFVAIYFFRSIMKPIRGITAVFDGLAHDKKVLEIPGIDREDEIGLLANAANIFREKNKQTVELLEQTKASMVVQKKLNDDVMLEKVRAEKALSVKTDFLANMSHELRTPLNSIIGFTVRLLKNEHDFDARQRKALAAVHKNGKHLLAMINDILDLSKVEAGKLALSFDEIDLYELTGVCIEQLLPTIEEKKLHLIYDEPEHGLLIVSDAVRLSQVLLNLFSNAVKYTDKGWVKVEVELDQPANHVHIHVSDSGVGIADDDMGKLFQRFEQLDHDTRYKVGHGTGLGLAIVANISRLLGAKVRVESELGVGSQFTLSLPLSQKM